jgi:hypothetical protein
MKSGGTCGRRHCGCADRSGWCCWQDIEGQKGIVLSPHAFSAASLGAELITDIFG